MNLLIKAAKIIDVSNPELHSKKRDILIKNGKIEKIAAKIAPDHQTETVSLKNLHISLGWFDSGVCFGEPGFEERETIANGLETAAKSGFTDIVLNPNTHPVPDSSSDIVFLKNAAKGQVTGLHPLGTLTMKAQGNDLAELFDMKNTGAVGFYDFKHPMENANLLKIALQYVSNFGGLAYSFPMDAAIAGKGNVNEGESAVRLGLKGIPALAEELRIARDLFILEYTGGKLHIPTLSTARSVKLIADAKKKGLDISCSVAIHNLLYTDSKLEEFDAAYKVMPPLRTKVDTKALIKGVKEGSIDFVTSDHIPMNIEEKQVEFENAAYGTIGLESSFGILNRIFETETAIGLLTKGRERYGMEQPKIKEGEAANLTLFDPEVKYRFEAKNIHSTSKNSMFLGAGLKGKVYGVIHNGRTLF
ncbi:dihydroorotase [Pricia antarctica]|uniref:Dihydroorotase n=1 Tax=Pricia antarctica TaxID=641691 RepID=A0A1G7EGU0_9FLAO|nr:dihydroorotase [Pricia antarctica]SDE62665.1 dihydroorotase [Pricia antarctica]